jgi:hypothetical protein
MSVSILMLSACLEGRWTHPTRSEAQAQQDWDICKAEVLAGYEHKKDTMAGGINLSGCMQSKGYTYVEGQALPASTDGPAPR